MNDAHLNSSRLEIWTYHFDRGTIVCAEEVPLLATKDEYVWSQIKHCLIPWQSSMFLLKNFYVMVSICSANQRGAGWMWLIRLRLPLHYNDTANIPLKICYVYYSAPCAKFRLVENRLKTCQVLLTNILNTGIGNVFISDPSSLVMQYFSECDCNVFGLILAHAYILRHLTWCSYMLPQINLVFEVNQCNSYYWSKQPEIFSSYSANSSHVSWQCLAPSWLSVIYDESE